MFRRFLADRQGNFAVLSALLMLPMILAVGFAIDGSRYYKARSHLQDAVDMAALAVAASTEQDTEKLRLQAEDFVFANLASNTIEGVEIASFSSDPEEISLGISGLIHTSFMRLANVDTMPVVASTLAKRAPERHVEVALVLDNTYSMIEKDPKTGETRIDTLRKAAKALVETLLPENGDNATSIALVPYADHVNVGIENKTAHWLQLNAEERTVTTGEGNRTCTTTTETVPSYCSAYGTTTCTRNRDGVTESYSCPDNSNCTKYSTTKKTQTCTGTNQTTTEHKFFGCVGTRTSGDLRLSDASSTSKYPAYVDTRQYCARPIIPMTKDRAKIVTAVSAMQHQVGTYYTALTHIPSGLLWGLNVLSPAQPFDEAKAYDPENQSPRKVMILMTDGDNTLIHNAVGKHVQFSTNANTAATQFQKANADTAALCANIKSQGIELYSIAFAVTKDIAKSLLRNCATSDAHYYDATDAAKLNAAFSGIARSISQVRLAR